MTRLVLPPLPVAARARLWLSYQRYGLLLVGGSAAAVAALVRVAPAWLWIPVALAAIAPVAFGTRVLVRWPDKVRATRIADHRIAQGRFAPGQVRSYCGDPCFRVVAAEILARAGIARAERRALIAHFRGEIEQRGGVLLLVDRAGGVVVTVGADGNIRRDALGAAPDGRRMAEERA